ncbi:MAG: CHASE2 domain-containing protein [Candidatus Omnitrophota bacterium]|nr:CHASE2 domain-containing protein [Candidatus Omnitrophota bacterium]
MKNKDFKIHLFIGLCAVLIAFSSPFVFPSKILQGLNDLPCWHTYYFSRKAIKPINLIGVAVDDYSLSKIPQRWPWKRVVYAELIKILDKEKVNTIGFDFAFVAESENREDDLILSQALKSASSRVVLAYFFNSQTKEPILPLAQLKESAYSVGFVNTPIDKDGKTRRLRSYVQFKEDIYYSFPVSLSAAYLNQSPQSIIRRLSLSSDNSFLINYLLKPKDIINLSFYEVINNLDALKKKYGAAFLKDALVLVYPEAEILHDRYPAPLGDMPGGFLNLNGAVDIISGRLIKDEKFLFLPFLVFSFVVMFILRNANFIFAGFSAFAISLVNLLGLVLLSLLGKRFDYSFVFIFTLSFFILSSIYKYGYFWFELWKIKYKATLEPLSGLFNLRFFCYRLELEEKEIFHKDLFLVFIYLGAFNRVIAELPLEEVKNLWQRMHAVISPRTGKEPFWSRYSPNEIIGYFVSSEKQIKAQASSLKNSLEMFFKENDIACEVKIGCLKFKQGYAIKELLFGLFKVIREGKTDLFFFKESALGAFLKSVYPKTREEAQILESISEDIEEKNQQLLSALSALSKEHAKTKEVFFEIIISLVNALEARDAYTQGHSERVAEYSHLMAKGLGWEPQELEKLRKAALLHDLGKIGIPDSILHKKDRLNEEEFSFIKRHSLMAVKILEPLKELNELLPWILHHHEKWNGSGYPYGLAGNNIPLASQIISLADVFDALSTGRDYKKALTSEESLKEIERNKGIQFNPPLADAFLEMIRSQEGLMPV